MLDNVPFQSQCDLTKPVNHSCVAQGQIDKAGSDHRRCLMYHHARYSLFNNRRRTYNFIKKYIQQQSIVKHKYGRITLDILYTASRTTLPNKHTAAYIKNKSQHDDSDLDNGEIDEDKENRPPPATLKTTKGRYTFKLPSSTSNTKRSSNPFSSLRNANDKAVHLISQNPLINLVKKTVKAVCLTSVHKTQTMLWAQSLLNADRTCYIFPLMAKDEFYGAEQQKPGKHRIVFTKEGDYAGVIKHDEAREGKFRLVTKHL